MSYLEEYLARHRRRNLEPHTKCPAHNEVDNDFDTELESPDLYYSTLVSSPEGIYRAACNICHVVPCTPALKQLKEPTLTLTHQRLGDADTKALAIALVQNNTVTTAHLSDNDIGYEGLKGIVDLLRVNHTLVELDLSNNTLGSAAARTLCGVLRSTGRLRKLLLAGNSFKDGDAQCFAQALQDNNSLRYLDLSHNEFGETGGIALGKAIGSSLLEHLDVSWNHLRLRGAATIAQSLETNTHLRTLLLSWNGFANNGACAMGRSLKVNWTLRQLDLTCNRINMEGAMAIADGLTLNRKLRVLKLSRNPITTAGACSLLTVIKRAPKCRLQLLELLDIEVNPQFEVILEEVKAARDFEVIHGGHVSHADPYSMRERRQAAPILGDPLALLMEHIKRSSLRLMDFFAQLDKDNNMSVSRTEFKRGMLMAKMPLTDDQIDKLMDQLDADKNGEITYAELLEGQRRYRERERKKAQVLLGPNQQDQLRPLSARYNPAVTSAGESLVARQKSYTLPMTRLLGDVKSDLTRKPSARPLDREESLASRHSGNSLKDKSRNSVTHLPLVTVNALEM